MRKPLSFLILTVSVFAFCGCGFISRKQEKPDDADAKVKQKEVVIPVEAGYPKRGDISQFLETTSRIEAETQVDITAEATGQCVEVFVEEGDRVRVGQIMAELEKVEALAPLAQSEVNVRQSRADFQRAESLLSEGLLSQADHDSTKFSYENAKATLTTQQIQLDKLTIRSPISGVVTAKSIQKGMLVSAGAAVFSVIDPSSLMVAIAPVETELPRLKVGQRAIVSVDSLDGKEFEAKVRRINPSFDATSGTVRVILDFGAEVRKQLRAGAFVRVRLIMDTHEDALLVAKDHLVEENARKYAFVIVEKELEEEDSSSEDDVAEDDVTVPETEEVIEEDDASSDAEDEDEDEDGGPRLVVERVEVEIGLEDGGRLEILEGITEESLMVTLGQQALETDARVRITNADDELRAKLGLSADEALELAKETEKELEVDADKDGEKPSKHKKKVRKGKK